MLAKPAFIAALMALFTLGAGTATVASAAPDKAGARHHHGKKGHKRGHARAQEVREPAEKKADYHGVTKRDSAGHFRGIPTIGGQVIDPPKNHNPFGPGMSGN